MAKRSAGILMYRGSGPELRLLLVHPGGPFWAKKDEGAWSIPKGEFDAEEEPLACAIREFEEELGRRPQAAGAFLDLGELVQPSGKAITAWGVEGDFDPSALKSNLFELEWPPRSGKIQRFPEVDRASFFPLEDARRKINVAQTVFLDRLIEQLDLRKSGGV